jgi:hypothetical protein
VKISLHDFRILAEQPERFIPPELDKDKLSSVKNLAIVEIAGRDSIAAAIKALETKQIDAFLPTLAYNGAQYGSLESVEYAVEVLARRVGREKVLNLEIIGSPQFWQALTVRFGDLLTEKFGFFTSYVACHLYIHAVRVPLAKRLNCKLLISGERESHDGKIKLNQTETVLDRYAQLISKFNIELYQPLRKMSAGQEIVDLIGEAWPQGERQLKCMVSGNYKNPDGKVDFGPGRRFSDEKSAQFLDRFALPLASASLEKILKHELVDYEKEAAKILNELG